MDEPLQLLWAMTLGWKTALSGEVAEPFMRSGTMHVFAISGLHIALIAAILVKLLRVLGVPRALCGVLIIPAIWLYTGLTGWQASAIRATIMSTVIIAGWSIKRPSDLVNSLAASGLLILLWDPQQLFQASFQLSFVVVLSLAVVGPFLIQYRDLRWLRYDPFLPESLVPRWRKNIHNRPPALIRYHYLARFLARVDTTGRLLLSPLDARKCLRQPSCRTPKQPRPDQQYGQPLCRCMVPGVR